MADSLSSSQRHYCMSQVHSSSTKPELLLRHSLWLKGFRYKVNDGRLPGKPDIVLPKYRTVVFVHGCFWHGHEGCSRYTVPQTNSDYWISKVDRNKNRDQETWRQLEAKGWYVIIVWECQLKKASLEDTINRVEAEILLNGQQYEKAREERKALQIAYQQERKSRQEKEAALMAELHDKFSK